MTKRKQKAKSTKRSWAWKLAHPIRYAYQTLKGNAKRRGKAFNITLDEFSSFDSETHYIDTKGRRADKNSIDRKHNDKGYETDNIQLLTLADNSAKGISPWKEGDPTPF